MTTKKVPPADIIDLRQRILDKDDIETEVIHVPQWDAKILIRGMTAGERARFLRKYINKEGELDFGEMYGELLVVTCYDPETEEKLFRPEDVDALNQKSGAAIELLAQAATRISALFTGAVAEAGKGSSSTPNTDSESKKQMTTESPVTTLKSVGPQQK